MVWNAQAASNWFLTWENEDAEDLKSFVLQIHVTDLTFRDVLSDGINSYVSICRQRNGPVSGWELIGKTNIIRDETSPAYPQGFRIFYGPDTDLDQDRLRIICYHRRDAWAREQVIGTATISLMEMVRTFGTKTKVELVRKGGKVMGSVWFLGEALPSQSPRGGDNEMRWKIAAMAPRKARMGIRTFLVVSREREDKTWAVLYRSEVVKRNLISEIWSSNKLSVLFPSLVLRQSEVVLGKTPVRRVRFEIFEKGKHGEGHVCIGEVTTSVDEILNEFVEDTSLSLKVDGEMVGEFACVKRKEEEERVVSFEVEVNYFDQQAAIREIEARRQKKRMNLDSP